jgi:sugar phosphate isomerase/epimerase
MIDLAGEKGRLHAYHICDWKTPTADLLNDRGLMGEGCINIPEITQWVDGTGFAGLREVEIFSHKHWAMDQDEWLASIINAYKRL